MISFDEDTSFIIDDELGGPTEGRKIYYNGDEIIDAPSRAKDFEVEENPKMPIKLMRNEPVLFMPSDVSDGYYSPYVLHIFGSLSNGAKAHIMIEDIDVFFDVKLPHPTEKKVDAIISPEKRRVDDDTGARPEDDAGARPEDDAGARPEDDAGARPEDDAEQFKIFILFRLKEEHPTFAELIKKYPVFGYHEKPITYVRVHFTSLKNRKAAIGKLIKDEYETASNDTSAYYRKVSREHQISFADWIRIKTYKVETATSIAHYEFTVKITDLENLQDAEKTKLKDRTLVMTWDTEVYTPKKETPRPENPDDTLFMLCSTFHWKDDMQPLLQVAIMDKDTETDKRWISIVCGSPQNVIKAFALIIRRMAPDIVLGFNDGDFDWPFIIGKGEYYEILPWFCQKISGFGKVSDPAYNIREQRIKISPEDQMIVKIIKCLGYVPIDVRVCFKKLFTRAEVAKGSSLKFYLEQCKLGGKADMPIPRMWRIYVEGKPESMRQIAHYCIIDALRCQHLMIKKNVINDYREVANLSYTSLSDVHFYAGGMRVCNMLAGYASRKEFVCSLTSKKKEVEGKYPGAYVFEPDKGLENRRPVTGLDFSSLYPSIIMTYNLSPEKIIINENEMIKLRNEGKDLHPIKFEFNGKDVIGWSVRHGNNEKNIGLFPTVLIDLFNKRKQIKTQLAIVQKEKEKIELFLSKTPEQATEVYEDLKKLKGVNIEQLTELYNLAIDGAKRGRDILKERLGVLSFESIYLDSKQRAVKVFMNTFYGESGNALSPFFLLQLAGGVTTAGRAAIQFVARMADEYHFGKKYGDTDSLYLTCPDEVFKAVDAQYAQKEIAKEQYYSEMVKITMKEMNIFRDKVNAALKEYSKTSYLSMAYEEVLFPVVFTGKKKYYGIPHVETPNFKQKIFIRGIEIMKMGQTGIAKTIGNEIMRQSMLVENERTLMDIVLDVLIDSIEHPKWTLKDFTKTDTYKPPSDGHPGNVRVLRFVERMKVKHKQEIEEQKTSGIAKPYLYEIPEKSERFSYVLVKPERKTDIFGKKLKLTKADCMEYVKVVTTLNLQPDIEEYIRSYVVGLCARFINYDKRFQPEDETIKSDYKKFDRYVQARAKTYIMNQIKTKIEHEEKIISRADAKFMDEGLRNFLLNSKVEFDIELDIKSIEKTVNLMMEKKVNVRKYIAEKFGSIEREERDLRTKIMAEKLDVDAAGDDWERLRKLYEHKKQYEKMFEIFNLKKTDGIDITRETLNVA
jgi:DNA polymerase elongation subunit (family B)